MELVCFPVRVLVAPGVSDLVFGSSGTLTKNKSNFSLKTLRSQFFRFLMLFGIELNNLGPETWKLCFLKVWTDANSLNGGSLQLLPSLSSVGDQLTPQKVFVKQSRLHRVC